MGCIALNTAAAEYSKNKLLYHLFPSTAMKKLYVILFCAFAGLSGLFAQGKADIVLKMGSNYYINCKQSIAFGDYSILSVSGDAQNGRMIFFDIYNPQGGLDASFRDGTFTGAAASYFQIQQIPDGFYILDSRSQHIPLKIVNVYNAAKSRKELHVWADFFLPNGGRFQCTPDQSNVPYLQMMQGSTFANNQTAIRLN